MLKRLENLYVVGSGKLAASCDGDGPGLRSISMQIVKATATANNMRIGAYFSGLKVLHDWLDDKLDRSKREVERKVPM